jgi:hypothetical protein
MVKIGFRDHIIPMGQNLLDFVNLDIRRDSNVVIFWHRRSLVVENGFLPWDCQWPAGSHT